MRDSIKILFNKGRVKITKTILGKPEKKDPYIEIYSNNKYYESYGWKKEKPKIIKCISPLGFYYNKTIEIIKKDPRPIQTTKVIKYYRNGVLYEITYLIEYNKTNIGIDTRPWELGPDSCSMPDHQLNALLKIIKEIIEESKGAVIKDKYTEDHFSFQNELMRDLFGDPKGPRFQTDEEKILSHGFDLKESFRTRKEK